jgi:hypothetical protein
VKIEARTNLIFSFEKMALRNAVKSAVGARVLDFVYDPSSCWCKVVAALPRKQPAS